MGTTKTTLYLPAELKRAITAEAQRSGTSEAQVIRTALQAAVGSKRPGPRAGLFASGQPIAREADRHLAGFGER